MGKAEAEQFELIQGRIKSESRLKETKFLVEKLGLKPYKEIDFSIGKYDDYFDLEDLTIELDHSDEIEREFVLPRFFHEIEWMIGLADLERAQLILEMSDISKWVPGEEHQWHPAEMKPIFSLESFTDQFAEMVAPLKKKLLILPEFL